MKPPGCAEAIRLGEASADVLLLNPAAKVETCGKFMEIHGKLINLYGKIWAG
jgi:hypothetical protein